MISFWNMLRQDSHLLCFRLRPRSWTRNNRAARTIFRAEIKKKNFRLESFTGSEDLFIHAFGGN